MINRLKLLRNIGPFDSVSTGASIALARLTLIFAENGRGKTTLAAILRSLATGDPIPIAERRRLAALHPPQVVLDCDGDASAAMFQTNSWSRTLPNIVVFDDVFVDQNVYSGLAVEPGHRQNLHELILGSRGVALNRQMQQLVARIEIHNGALRTKAAAIPEAARGALSADDFCDLPWRSDIDAAIQATERGLAAAREQDPIRNTSPFETIGLPGFDIAAIDGILQEDLPFLDTAAAARVQAHVGALGPGGETWIADGMRRVPRSTQAMPTAACPFCAQELVTSPVISHYRAYFSGEYSDLKRRLSEAVADANRAHGGDVAAAFERSFRVAVERRQFWSRFCDISELSVDTAAIVRDWRAARDAVVATLAAKQGAPLERMTLSPEARAALAAFEVHRRLIATLSTLLQKANGAIRVVKEQAVASNPRVLAADLSRLQAVKAQHMPAVAALCDDYTSERAEKARTELARGRARVALDQYRTNVFPSYETAVNDYLRKFCTGFRLGNVGSTQTRGGAACSYNVVINNTPVPIEGGTPSPGEPSFRNTLSAGDRNALALALFFAALDQDPELANKIIVIDDPVSSLDDQRSLTTVQEMRRLTERVGQVIVLSHTKPFLCRLWEGADPTARAALDVAWDGTGSTLRPWDVSQDCITEYDRRHAMLRQYLVSGTPNNREVARAIRPLLEGFLRVAFPEHSEPGTLLGPFRNLCQERVGTSREILSAKDTQELDDLVEYANRFHHATNLARETDAINDTELAGFVRRTMAFAKR